MKRKPIVKTLEAEPPVDSDAEPRPGRIGDVKDDLAGVEPAEAQESDRRIDLARSRIAKDYYSRAHVRNRILKAILGMLETDE